MKRKGITIFIGLILLICFFTSCTNEMANGSSSIPASEHMIVASVDEGVEYPEFNESISFSDVSVPLLTDISSTENSSHKDKSSSSKTTTTSSTRETSSISTPSTPTPSKNSSVSVSSEIISELISSENSSIPVLSEIVSLSPSSECTSISVSSEPPDISISSKVTSLTISSNPLSAGNSTVKHDSMKAVWISYIDFAHILTGKSEEQFRNSFKKVCENAVDFGINTLVCHVRAFGDAFYDSEYFAWSRNVAGIGRNPGYDPLKIMIEIAHQHKLSFHAWINPFRAYLDTEVSKVPTNYIFKKWYNDSSKNGRNIVKVGNRWYFNPGEPEARELVLNGVVEIINNYNVDGIHFDDYFYPTTDSSFDSTSYKLYGEGKALSNWRRENVNTLIKSIYNTIKKKNSNIVFGISPDANVTNDLNTQFADVKLWGSQDGYVDYLCPQIYYSYKSESYSFQTALSTWNDLVTAPNVKLMVGLAVDRIGLKSDTYACKNKSHTDATQDCGKFGWQTSTPSSSNILASQYEDCMSLNKCSGVFLYSYQYLFNLNSFNASRSVSNAAEQAKYEIQKLKSAMK